MGSEAEEMTPELKVLHETDSNFRKVANYKTYCFLYKWQTYNEKLAACRGKYAKRTRTLTKAYKFNNNTRSRYYVF